MSVSFDRVTFLNMTSEEIALTVEAPIATRVFGPTNVGPNMTQIVPINRSDCPSTAITVNDSAHGSYTQTFAITQAIAGRQSYLQSVDAQYDVGEFWGTFVAGTGAPP